MYNYNDDSDVTYCISKELTFQCYHAFLNIACTCCFLTLFEVCCDKAIVEKRRKEAANYQNYHLLPNVERLYSQHGTLDGFFDGRDRIVSFLFRASS